MSDPVRSSDRCTHGAALGSCSTCHQWSANLPSGPSQRVEIPSWAEREGAEWRLVPTGSLDAVMALDPADHATKSRDYGRGFAEALRIVHGLLTQPSDKAARAGAKPDLEILNRVEREFINPPRR